MARRATAAQPEIPPHLQISGWITPRCPAVIAASKSRKPIRSRRLRAGCEKAWQAPPVLRRIVSRDRLFDPIQRKLAERLDRRPGRREVPALVGIDHEPLACSEADSDLAYIGQIAFHIEGNLQLEGAVAAFATHGDVFGAPLDEVAGIRHHRLGLHRSAEHFPERQPALRAARSESATSMPAMQAAKGPGSPL